MNQRSILLILFFSLLLLMSRSAKTLDPYKVLGVDRNASQRDIQKAFHKLSLQYHPDKNKNKGAQEKFAEINNAYEILSDEEKKKNYDLYGDEKGNPGFDGRNFENGDGYTYFTTGGPGGGPFTSGPGGWQNMGSQGNAKPFFSFGADGGGGSGNPFDFDFGNVFSNLFSSGMKGGKQQHGDFSGRNQFGGFSGSGGSKSGFASDVIIEEINPELFNKNIKDGGLTWLLLFYTPHAEGYRVLESLSEDVASSLQGALKAGKINCISQKTLCRDLGVSPLKYAKLFVYSFRGGDSGSLAEYAGESDARALKNFCQDYLPRFSKRADLRRFDFSSSAKENLPQVLLLSTKKDTPVMWRVLSGLYRKKILFYDAEVHDASHPMLKRLGVEAFPAVVGRLVNGEERVLKAGIVVKDLKSGISELRTLLESFEKKNRKLASSRAKTTSEKEPRGKHIHYLATSNMDSVCGDNTAVCIIGVFRSSKAKEKLEAILSEVSQKTLVRRRQNEAYSSGDSVSYALLDASKQSAFLFSFDGAGFKSLDKLLVAYKPRKGKFAVYTDRITIEEVEKFVSSVLSGDVRFSNVRQKPVLK